MSAPDSRHAAWWLPFTDQGVLAHLDVALDGLPDTDTYYQDVMAEIDRRSIKQQMSQRQWIRWQRDLRTASRQRARGQQ